VAAGRPDIDGRRFRRDVTVGGGLPRDRWVASGERCLTLLALGFATFYERTHGLMWVAPIIGVWLIAAPWVVRGIHRTTAMNLSQIIVGVCVVLLGLGLSIMVRFRTQH